MYCVGDKYRLVGVALEEKMKVLPKGNMKESDFETIFKIWNFFKKSKANTNI